MANKQHLETINQAYRVSQSSDNFAFEKFQRLPIEIRLCIWRSSLEHHRLLEALVEAPPSFESERATPWEYKQHMPTSIAQQKPEYTTTNSLGNLISGQRVLVIVKSYQLYSKLLRVNRESRGAALRFYRVHFPCHFMEPGLTLDTEPRIVHKTLYLNPEYDFIHIKRFRASAQQAVDLLHDLKAYDPPGYRCPKPRHGSKLSEWIRSDPGYSSRVCTGSIHGHPVAAQEHHLGCRWPRWPAHHSIQWIPGLPSPV